MQILAVRNGERNVRAVPRLHQGNGGDQRNRRLTDPDRMHYFVLTLLAQGLAHRNDVVDVIFKVEPAADQRNRPGIHLSFNDSKAEWTRPYSVELPPNNRDAILAKRPYRRTRYFGRNELSGLVIDEGHLSIYPDR